MSSPLAGAIETFASMVRIVTSPLNGIGLPSSPVTVTDKALAVAGSAATAVNATTSALRALENVIKVLPLCFLLERIRRTSLRSARRQ